VTPPLPDEGPLEPELPLKPGKAIKTWGDKMTDFEKGEILDFK